MQEAIHVHFETSELPMARFSRSVPGQEVHILVEKADDAGIFQFVLPDCEPRPASLWIRGVEANFGGCTLSSEAPDLRGSYRVTYDALPGFIGPMLMGALRVGTGAYVYTRDGAVDVWGFGDLGAAQHIFDSGLTAGQYQGVIEIGEVPAGVQERIRQHFPDFG